MKNLEGRKGWLKVYIITGAIGLLVGVVVWWTTSSLAVHLGHMSGWLMIYGWLELLAGFFFWTTLIDRDMSGKWVIKWQRCWLTYCSVAAVLWGIYMSSPQMMFMAAGPATWLWYFSVSKRVKATYYDKPEPELELALIED